MPYIYHNTPVIIPKEAEVSAAFRPNGGAFSETVQNVLDEVEPWEVQDAPIETFDLPHLVGARAVLVSSDETPRWGIHPSHNARIPCPSPFIELGPRDRRHAIGMATLELAGTVDKPILTRVYPGDYIPPLPWMGSAADADGGPSECVRFWNRHAFVLRTRNTPKELSHSAPDWYMKK